MSETNLAIGEYFLHILIEETAALQVDSGYNTSPTITVKSMGRSQQTRDAKENVSPLSSVFWGDHFYFSKKYDRREDIESDLLIVQVFDHSKLFKDSMIGQVELNLSTIYFEPDHTMKNKWFILQHKQRDYQKIMGYIKLSVNLAFIKDDRPKLEPESSNKLDSISSLSIPPEVKLEKKQLKVSIFQAINLMKMDTSFIIKKSCDAYVTVLYGDQSIKTNYIPKSLNPEFKTNLLLPVADPMFITKLVIVLKDHDTMSADDLIGTLTFDLTEVKKGKLSLPFWAHIYGSPPEASISEAANLMDNYPAAGKHS